MTSIPTGVRSLLVCTPCSALKANPQEPIDLGLFNGPYPDQQADMERQFTRNVLPAREMYQGPHHRSVMESVDKLRGMKSPVGIEVAIISAKYGVLSESDEISPYDESFDRGSLIWAKERAQSLGINEHLNELARQHEVIVFLLSSRYLEAIGAPLRSSAYEIYFAANSFMSADLSGTVVPCGREQAREMGVSPRLAKAIRFRRFVDDSLNVGLEQSLHDLIEKD